MVSDMLGKCRNTFTYAKINKCMEQIFDAIANFDELGMKVFIDKLLILIITYMVMIMMLN